MSVGGFDIRLSGYGDDDLCLRLFRPATANMFTDRALSQWRIFVSSSGHSLLMYISAMVYMEKLSNELPNDKHRGRRLERE
jgi:hypothetical protein